jgi:glycosyltransferase involved in cell wall biosynthesis
MVRLQREWLSQISIILVNSERSRRILREQSGLESHVVYPCISFAGRLNPNELPDIREDFFLVVHRIGYDSLFDNIHSICEMDQELNLVIAGSVVPGRSSKIIKKFEQFGNRIRFISNPSENQLESLYLRARGLLHPGVENFNLPVLEAASFGCPFVTCRESGVFEVFNEHSDAGFLEGEGKKLEPWLGMIAELRQNVDTSIQLGKKQYEIARHFTRMKHAKELSRYLEV